MLLVLGALGDDIAKMSDGVKAVSVFVVKPLVDEIYDREIADAVWEAGVSVLLKVGVHPELRRALEISWPQLVRLCWRRGEAPVAVRSLWNVLTELQVD